MGITVKGSNVMEHILIAAAVSALLLFTIRPLLLTALRRSSQPHPTNVDALYGMAARVTAPFVDGRGFVRLDNGEQWTAELAPAAPALSPGERAVVTAVRGATVEVAPAPSSPASGSPAASDSPERSTD